MRLVAALLSIAAGALGACATPTSVRSTVLEPQAVSALSCVAVLPFENLTADRFAGQRVAQEVASTLLTSERFDVLQPDETEQVLRLLDVRHSITAEVGEARRLGEALGVSALLTGAVTSYESHELTRRTPNAEPVVGFAARLVEVRTGNVLWSTTASDFDYPFVLAIPEGRDTILREAVDRSTQGLVDAHEGLVSRGLCAKAYKRIEQGEVTPASLAAVPPVGSPAPGPKPPATTAGLSTQPQTLPAPTTPAMPAPSQPAGGGLGLPPLPPDSNGGALPALPDLPAGSGGSLGLPPLPGGNGRGDALPALPDLGDVPPLPGDSAGGGGLPSLESGEPAARSPGAAPASLLRKLRRPAKALARQLYGKRPAVLRVGLPLRASSRPSLVAKSKKALNDLGSILKANPSMRVRVEVLLDLKGRDATDAAMSSLSSRQAQLMADYLQSKYRLGPDRVSVVGMGRARLLKKAGAAVNSRAEVVVLSY